MAQGKRPESTASTDEEDRMQEAASARGEKEVAAQAQARDSEPRPNRPRARAHEPYLITAQDSMAGRLDLKKVEQSLRDTPEIEIVEVLALDEETTSKRLDPLRDTPAQAGFAAAPAIILARMSPQQADALRQQTAGQLLIEPDGMLTLAASDLRACDLEIHDPGVAAPNASGVSASFVVTGNGRPLQGAAVHLFGRIWSAEGVTGADGRVHLTIYGEAPDSLTALYVKPRSDYWSFWLRDPAITPDETHTIELTPLSQALPGFPQRQFQGWGQKAMGLDRLPASWRGRGVKVALIDSGVATGHRNLGAVRAGFDAIDPKRRDWNSDEIGHGSHCAGIIAGGGESGIRGFAPEAEIHVCRMFPGGRFSDLIRALDYCIAQKVDVIDLGLGSREPSQIVDRRIALAKQLGIACIAAAGNYAGSVEYPAASTRVLAVAAMGRAGEYPAESYHAQQSTDGFQGARTGGLFCARFSCHGPEVDLIAPGVAIISTVPPDGFAAWDGTSLAAAHVTGLAALLLAHHPDFAGPFRERTPARVERLFQILKETANRLPLGEPDYVGAGMPDAVRAFNLDLPGSATAEGPAEQLARLFGTAARAGSVHAPRPGNGSGQAAALSRGWLELGTVPRGPAATGIGPLTRLPIAVDAMESEVTLGDLRRELDQVA